MERQPKSLADVVQLIQTADIISSTVQTIISAWSKEAEVFKHQDKSTDLAAEISILPSHELFNAQRTIVAAIGKLAELVSEPSVRILEVAMQFQESRALYIAVERRIPDILAPHDKKGGLSIVEIGRHACIEHRKLSRIMRCLCSIGIFCQTGPETFANNAVSAALVSNEPLRAYVRLANAEAFTAADHLPVTLLDPDTGPSYDVAKTAFQNAICTSKPRWEWIEEKVEKDKLRESGGHYPGIPSLALESQSNADNGNGLVARPELEIMGLAMVGGGRVLGTAHVYDFPWASLGKALVVDVGGGVGGFSLQLSKVYPDLRFVIQDRGPVLQQGRERVWPTENPRALKTGRVEFMEHNFFDTNPIEGADVYFLRYVLHDWSDGCCINILSRIRESMAPSSRLLICEQVMNTTRGDPHLPSAPEPLPANYGCYTRFSHSRDLTMMGCINGIERTPEEFKTVLGAAGLELKRIWECRSQVSLLEAVLPEAKSNGNGFGPH
ncbi:S-adenosyl-L-methionine-dependent methyltransferase [Aspergillus ambiguus]|uniref:O-methyltransferase tpcA n=1 Tax=Aspergillus ambiguus TaxID=176160 RepID=UPI003CCDE218